LARFEKCVTQDSNNNNSDFYYMGWVQQK